MERNIKFYASLKEDLKTDLKSAKNGLPESIWETYSSFANTCGGVIYLGIEEGNPNKVVGVKDPEILKKDFFTTINNQQKVNKNILKDSDFNIVKINDLYVIEIIVPEAIVYDKPIYLNGSILNSFKRNYEGDFKINQLDLIQMIDDSKVLSRDSLPNKMNFGYEAIDLETLKNFRNDLNKNNPNNIFIDLNDEEFLIKSGFLLLNEDGKYVLNNAGLLLFSLPSFIKQVNPDYFLDYQEVNNLDDNYWINRITTDDIDYVGNLYNFFLRVLKALTTNLPKPFLLEGVKDVGEENIMFMIRESFLNSITNANFNYGSSIKIIRSSDRLVFQNSGKLKIPYDQAIKYGNSDPRNKTLMSVFRNLKLCDRGGTGLPRIFTISEKLKLYRPSLLEDSVLNTTTLTIYLKHNTNSSDNLQEILNYLEKNNDYISIGDLSVELNINRTYVSNIVNDLIKDGIIITNGQVTKGKKIKLK